MQMQTLLRRVRLGGRNFSWTESPLPANKKKQLEDVEGETGRPDAGQRVRSSNLISVTAATKDKDRRAGVGGPGDATGPMDGFI